MSTQTPSKNRRKPLEKPAIVDPLIPRELALAEIGVSKTTGWRMISKGRLPKPVRVGHKTGWPRSVLNKWKIEQGWPDPDA